VGTAAGSGMGTDLQSRSEFRESRNNVVPAKLGAAFEAEAATGHFGTGATTPLEMHQAPKAR
jgi:hypothetical protein